MKARNVYSAKLMELNDNGVSGKGGLILVICFMTFDFPNIVCKEVYLIQYSKLSHCVLWKIKVLWLISHFLTLKDFYDS